MASNPATYYVAFHSKKSGADTGNYTYCSAGSSAANNAALWLQHTGGTTVQARCRASGTTSSAATIANALTDWTVIVARFAVDTGIGVYTVRVSVDGGAFTSQVTSAGTAVAINSLSFGAGVFNSSVFEYFSNLNLAYIGVYGDLTTDEVARLATHAPALVAPSQQIWVSDSELVQVGGSVSDTFSVTGSDIVDAPSDNPSLITDILFPSVSPSLGPVNSYLSLGRNIGGGYLVK